MDAVVAFIANGEGTKPVEPGERALDDPPEHAKTAAVKRAATGLRKQRLEARPQRIVQERLCHARPYQVDRASTRDQPEVLKRALKLRNVDRACPASAICHARLVEFLARHRPHVPVRIFVQTVESHDDSNRGRAELHGRFVQATWLPVSGFLRMAAFRAAPRSSTIFRTRSRKCTRENLLQTQNGDEFADRGG